MGNVMKVLIHAKQVMEDNAEYGTIGEWLKEEGRDEVLKILYNHIKDKMESYMLGNYEYFHEYAQNDHNILGCEEKVGIIKAARGWDDNIRNIFADNMDRFIKAMTGAGFQSMKDFLLYAEKNENIKMDCYGLDTAVYNLRHAADTYGEIFDYASYLAVIDEQDDVSTKVGTCLDDIKQHPEDWALIHVSYA